MMIALTVLAIATTALTGVFVTGHLTLRRASQSDTAAVLAEKLVERFHAETWDNVALSAAQVTTAMADATYAADAALNDSSMPAGMRQDITEANAPLGADGAPAATPCGNTPTPVACNPSRSIPDTTQTPAEVAPDGRSYRLDTYVTWGCPESSETLGGSMSAPTCSIAGVAQPYAPVKVVTIVVRDASTATTLAGKPVYRTSTTFDRLSGGSMPTVTVSPSGSGTGTTSTTSSVTGAPNPPTAAPTFVNGGGSGSPCPCVTVNNQSALSFDVSLPSTSVASDTVILTVGDGDPSHTVTKTASATQGAGIVHFTQVNGTAINGTGLSDGTITFSAVAHNNAGDSTATVGTTAKDTIPPSGVAITSPAEGATSVPRTGPFVGTAGIASGDRTTVTLQFCADTTWTCGSSPAKTSSATVDGSGNWTVTLGSQLQNNHAYTVRVVQQDAAGNTTTTSDRHFHT